MSTLPIPDERPIDPDDESLVAYLDGELDPPERKALEQRLLQDDSLRVRLQELQQSWDWLEQLPSSQPSDKMVESTLELVVSDIVEAQRSMRPWHQRLRTPLLVVAALLVPPLLAFGAVKLQRAADYQRQLKDLAIAENVDAYLEANDPNDLNLVRELANHDRWNQMILAAREVGMIPLDSTPIVVDVPIDQREAKLRQLSIDQRTSLATRWDRFTQLPPDSKSHVREMHETVRRQTDAPTLIKTMKDYAAWKETIRPQLADRIEGRDTPGEPDLERQRQAINEAIDETVRELTNRSGTNLVDESVDSIFRVLEHIVIIRLAVDDPGTAQLVDYFHNWFSNVSELTDSDPEKIAIRAAIPHILRADGSPPRLFGGPRDLPPLAPLSVEELEWIESVLAEEDRKRLDLIAGDSRDFRMMYLHAWAQEAANRNSPGPSRGDGSLRERYLSLSQEHRARIDLDDPEKLGEHLSRGRRSRGRSSRSSDGDRSDR